MTFYATTAIFYANDRLHIGHWYELLAADVLARYHRARGEQVRLLTGTDEHGTKIERRARELGTEPQSFVDGIAHSVRDLADTLNISYDDFIRTTEERHRLPVQSIFTRLCQQGDICLDSYEGWYCQFDEAFVTDSAAALGNLCPECGRLLEWTREPAYRFRLSRFGPQIE